MLPSFVIDIKCVVDAGTPVNRLETSQPCNPVSAAPLQGRKHLYLFRSPNSFDESCSPNSRSIAQHDTCTLALELVELSLEAFRGA